MNVNIEPQDAVRGVVAVITSGTRLLMIRRSKTVIAPLKICFPGGGIHPGETEEEALCRELQEELAASVEPRRCLWRSVTPWQVSLAWWLTDLPTRSGIRANPQEVDAWDWYELETIEQTPDLLESNRQFFAAWRRGEFELPLPGPCHGPRGDQ